MKAFEITRSHERIAAVIDIAAGAAGVAIVSIPKSGPSKVLAAAASHLSLDEKTPDQHRSGIARHIADAGQDALKQYAAAGHRSPVRSLYAVLHAPWSQTRTVSVRSDLSTEDVRITDAMIGRLGQDALEGVSKEERATMYEATTIRVMLNGYPTADPVGKSAREIELTALMSGCDQGIKGAAQTAIEALFPGIPIIWRSFTRAIISLFGEISPYGQYVAIDMCPDATRVISYRFGVLEERTVPEGVATILARLAKAPPEETLSNIRMLSRDACSTDACEKIQKAMAIAEPELVRVFGEALGQLATPRRVSNELLLVTHPDLETWLAPFFARIDFSQFTTTTLPLTVHTPASIDMAQFIDGDMPDVALAVSCALVNIEETA